MKLPLLILLCLTLAGCASNKIDWGSRIGNYTYDQAVLELGPPDKMATLTDGTRVGEWMTARGHLHGGGVTYIGRGRFMDTGPIWQSPDYFVRLTFDQEGRLTDFRKVTR